MKKGNIINIILVIVAVALLVVFAFYVRIKPTANNVAVLITAGMTCGSCSSKITKALESLKGVAVTEVDVNGGWVIVGYDTKTVKPESLAQKVSGTGFASNVYGVLTPEEFKQITGRNVGQNAAPSRGCGGGKGGGCGANKQI